MKTIYKYQTPINHSPYIIMPAGAKIVYIESLYETIQIWAEVRPDAPDVTRQFAVHGTGHPIPDNNQYIGTALHPPFVWHLYEIL